MTSSSVERLRHDEVRQQEGFLAALDQSPLPMWLSNPDYDGTFFNRAWLEFRGRSLAQEIGGGWIDGIHPEDRDGLAGYADALAEGRPFRVEYRLRRHDGAWRWMLDSATPRFGADGALEGFIGSCVDITDRIETEQALRHSEARLQLAQEAAALGIYDWDIAENRITWSPEMFRLYGLPAQQGLSAAPEGLVTAWIERLHPEDRARCEADLAAGLAAGGTDRMDMSFRILHPELGLRWIEGRGRLERDGSGRAVRLIGVNIDVTERRETETALAESEARLVAVAENFPGYIFRRVSHPDGRIEYPLFSGGAEGTLGFVREAAGTHDPCTALGRLVHPDDRAALAESYAAAHAGMNRMECEGRLIRPDGEARWIRSVSQPHPGPEGTVIWDGVMLDVTETREREAARERSAMLLRMSIEVAAIGTWEFDPVSRTILASARTDALFGLPPSDTPRPMRLYLDRIHPEDREAVESGITGPLADGAETVRSYRLLGGADGPRRVSTRGRMVRLADGSRRLIGAMTDVTAAHSEAEARDAALAHRQTLLAELNHRMKNNLHLILSMLRLEANRSDRPEALVAATERIEAVADLHAQLGFSGDEGRVEFGAYLEDLAAKLRRSVLAHTDIALECDVAALDLDLDRAVPLGLVANELITNALKYAFPEGRGRIFLGLSRAEDGGLMLVIEDDGRGPGADHVRPAAPAGSGLGARLVAGLCDQIGARLESRSLPGLRHEIHLPPRG